MAPSCTAGLPKTTPYPRHQRQRNVAVARLRLASGFNLYIPDLVFFGDSYSSRPERSEIFQARCVMALMDAHRVKKMMATGISYGGFMAYHMATQFGERIDRLVLCCAGVCMEEKDMENGMFQVKNVEEAMNVLLPQKPHHVRDLMKISFYKPVKNVPSCLSDIPTVPIESNLVCNLEDLYRERRKGKAKRAKYGCLLSAAKKRKKIEDAIAASGPKSYFFYFDFSPRPMMGNLYFCFC
ncbi:hypothetical protein EV1_040032 [Malus domestica]